MRQLRQCADLSYRQLERRAALVGDVLPRATVAAALARNELPRADLLAAYVRACGGSPETVEAWLDARRRLAIAAEAGAPADAAPARTERPEATAEAVRATTPLPTVNGPATTAPPLEPASVPPRADDQVPTEAPTRTHARRRRTYLTVSAVALSALLTAAFLLTRPGHPDTGAAPRPTDPTPLPASSPAPSPSGSPTPAPIPSDSPAGPAAPQTPAAPAPPAATSAGPAKPTPSTRPPTAPATTPAPAGLPTSGWAQIKPAASGQCLTEGRERNGRTDREIAVQLPCNQVTLPRTYLEKVGSDTYRVQWHHPDHGIGCLAVDGAYTGPGALLAPHTCTSDTSQRFRLEPLPNGYRLRPVHSGLCIGLQEPVAQGAEAIQENCTSGTDQTFRIEAA
ncbi:RICIN domain-containing protein [Kitasatospora camelliae]|uniref:RICIN domain-containing protein n=1 Tax=Kitasatospora camelliae TaxID=3156397 RepID=A0AAU8KAL2_9ACTN